MKPLLTNLFFVCLSLSSFSQQDEKPKWDITKPHGPSKTVAFDTDEGTWMAVDVSPDGKHVVFDLLGDIYIMPISGGNATLLAGGLAFETQPRFSPDGKRIVFTSDRDGVDNIWVMNVDGSNMKQITKEKERQLNNPVWTPDGYAVIARKHYRNTRSAGAGEMWMYYIEGGEGLQLTKRKNWEQDAGEPCLSPDGRYLYYSEDVTTSGRFEYNKNPHDVIYAIKRLDRETGKTEEFVREIGGSFRPQISPDGKTLALVRRVLWKTALILHDIESGTETLITDELSRDAQEGWCLFGVYPGFAWTPDGKSIIIWAKGKIRRVEVATKIVTSIPFRASVKQEVVDALRMTVEVAPEKFDVKMLRWVTVSPDRKSVVFQALGKLWIRSLPNGEAKRVTKDEEHFELFPSFSPDGKWIAYATWNDRSYGSIRKIRTDGTGGMTLTDKPGHYVQPSFSFDGKAIVYRRIGGDLLRGKLHTHDQGVYLVGANGGQPSLVTVEGSNPRFNRSNDRIFLLSREGEKNALISVGLKGEDRRVHFLSENAEQIIPSPDEKWVALVERYHVHLSVFPKTGQPVNIGPNTKDFPQRQVTRDAGSNITWSADSKTLFWSHGPELFSRDISETFAFVPGAPDSVQTKPDSVGAFIGFATKSDVPEGRIALTGGMIVTMKGDEVIPNATMIVERNRIVEIGPSSQVKILAGTKPIDVSGKYLIPGLVDMHAHIGTGSSGITPQNHWGYRANLAFGVTTTHDPSNNTEMVFANAETIKAGKLLGPRVFSTGTILYGAEAPFKAIVNNFEDALSHLRRLKAVGAFTVKSYNQPRRDQRQQIVDAARQLGMMVVPEGGSTFFWNLTQILDGHTGIEHNLPPATLHNDVIQLMARSQTGITPTLVVAYGAMSGEMYWYMADNVWENERLMRFVPKEVVHPRSIRRTKAPDEDFGHIEHSQSLKKLVDAGVIVCVGGHGQMQGLAMHWEMANFVQGGMTPHQALRCATINGARYIGLDRDIGSLEAGKLADVVILDGNPLDEIRNAMSVRYVMVNGRLYDGKTLDEIEMR